MNKVMHWWMILACLVSFFSSITASQIFILPNNALNRLGQQKNCSCPDIHLYYYQISKTITTTPGPSEGTAGFGFNCKAVCICGVGAFSGHVLCH